MLHNRQQISFNVTTWWNQAIVISFCMYSNWYHLKKQFIFVALDFLKIPINLKRSRDVRDRRGRVISEVRLLRKWPLRFIYLHSLRVLWNWKCSFVVINVCQLSSDRNIVVRKANKRKRCWAMKQKFNNNCWTSEKRRFLRFHYFGERLISLCHLTFVAMLL